MSSLLLVFTKETHTDRYASPKEINLNKPHLDHGSGHEQPMNDTNHREGRANQADPSNEGNQAGAGLRTDRDAVTLFVAFIFSYLFL